MGTDDGITGQSLIRSVYNNNGNLHNQSGPAIIYEDGDEEWWIHGREVTYEVKSWLRQNSITLPFSKEDQMLFDLTFSFNNDKPFDVFELLQNEVSKEINREILLKLKGII